MPKLKIDEIQERYKDINESYLIFTYLITKYGVDNNKEYNLIHQVARDLRLKLKKFI